MDNPKPADDLVRVVDVRDKAARRLVELIGSDDPQVALAAIALVPPLSTASRLTATMPARKPAAQPTAPDDDDEEDPFASSAGR